MPVRLFGSLLTLVVTLAVYGMYVALAVPWLDTAPQQTLATDSTIPREPPAARFEHLIRSQFPEGSWERGEVNVLRTRQLLLIWKSHETAEARRLRVYPLSIVLMDDSPRDVDGQGEPQRTWVMRAPAGAILQFDDDLNLAAGRFGRFHSGFIPGTVTTTGAVPPSPGSEVVLSDRAEQPIEILTKNLQFDDRRIWTSDEVSFQWGPNFGTGRDLMITMAPDSADQTSDAGIPSSAVESLRLMHLERLHLTTPSRSSQFPGPIRAPLDVTAGGALTIDLVAGVCRLTDRVQVERRNAEGQWQRLTCSELSLHFAEASCVADEPESSMRMPQFALTRAIAQGEPVTLESSSSATPQGGTYGLEAAMIRYQFPAGDSPSANTMPGPIEVSGPGRILIQQQADPPQQVVVRFQQVLQWRPLSDGGVLHLAGAAACEVAGAGRFSADAMELQVRLDPDSSFGWQPVRMQGRGNVEIASPRLQVRAGDMRMAFVELAGKDDPAPADELRLGAPRPSVDHAIDLRDPAGPRIGMQGDRIELQLVGRLPQLSLHAAALIGRVRCQELPAVPAAPSRVSLAGDEIRYADLGRRQWRVDVVGKPAVVRTESAELTGTNIHVDAGQNRAWMDGPGIASLPLPNQFLGPPSTRDLPRAQLTWNRDMQFDGVQLVCRDGVSCRGPYQLLRGRLLALRLAKPVQLRELQIREGAIELATTSLEGDVFCENRTLENGSLVAIDTAQMQQLRYEHRTAKLDGMGPGWVETVRRGDFPFAAQPSPASDAYRFLRVDFERGLQGDLNRREVRFGDYVRTVYGPVQDWSDRITATVREELPPEGILLQCRELVVLQSGTGTAAARPLEFLALGETTIDGREFTATAERLSYDQGKDLLVLEGNERTQAQIWYQAQTGDKRSKEVARKILFRPKTKELRIEGLQFLEFRTTGRK